MTLPGPPRYGVVGHPIAHSLSPQIHAAFAQQTGVVLAYDRIDAPLDGFASTVQAFFGAGGRGLNVTVPFKLEAFAWCDGRVSERARRAGAVNCLRVAADGVHGDNTDGVGLVDDLRRLLADAGRSLIGARILLLGAGGAARGVLAPLAASGADTIVVAARNVAKAEALVAKQDDACIEARLEARPMDAIDAAFDLVVNATSASLGGGTLALPSSVLGRAHLVYDMMYGAGPTPFLVEAARAGAVETADGLGMLVGQAAESFSIWHGVRPATAPVLAMLRATLAAPR